MSLTKLILTPFVITIHLFLFSQEKCKSPVFEKLPLIWVNETENRFYAIGDTTQLFYFDIKQKQWWKQALKCENKLEDIFNNYLPIALKDGNYFVYRGCGVVYKLVDGEFVRNDHSFEHKNQMGAALFSKGDTLFMFGGYGLFTTKNFISYYTPFMKEWLELRHKNKKNEIPVPLCGSLAQIHKNDVFIFSGLSDIDNPSGYMDRRNDVWKFNLLNRKWNFLGKLNFDAFKLPILLPSNRFYLDGIKILMFNLNKNTVHQINTIPLHSSQLISYNNNNRLLLIAARFENKPSYFMRLIQLNSKNVSYVGSVYVKQPKQVESKLSWIYFSLIAFLVFISMIIIFKRFKKKRLHKIVIRDGQIIINNKPVASLFNTWELNILHCLIAKADWVELQTILELVSTDDVSFEALKKRRETAIDRLKDIISEQTGLVKDDVFETKRDENDRRVKLIRMNLKIINYS